MSRPGQAPPRGPDLDSRERIAALVDAFYAKLLADPALAPIFLEVAAIELETHLPRIRDYWCKLLLGEAGYNRHTMNIHRALHGRRPLSDEHFQRWLQLFASTVDERFRGCKAERAKRVARAIADNMRAGIAARESPAGRSRRSAV